MLPAGLRDLCGMGCLLLCLDCRCFPLVTALAQGHRGPLHLSGQQHQPAGTDLPPVGANAQAGGVGRDFFLVAMRAP